MSTIFLLNLFDTGATSLKLLSFIDSKYSEICSSNFGRVKFVGHEVGEGDEEAILSVSCETLLHAALLVLQAVSNSNESTVCDDKVR